MKPHLVADGSRRWTVLAAVLLLTAIGSLPAQAQQNDGGCRITGGYAAVLTNRPLPDGSMAFKGAVLVVTRGCGTGPKGVSASFRPIAGTPASCEPTPSARFDDAACTFTGSLGAGVEGTPVVVSATAYAAGLGSGPIRPTDAVSDPGSREATSQCVLILPEAGGRYGCSLF